MKVPTEVKEAVSFKNPDEVISAIKDVRNDSTDTDWMLTCYEDPSKMKEIIFDSKGKNIFNKIKGSGGVEELKKHIQDGNVYYGMVRVKDVYDGNVTIKFVFIHVQSDKIKTLVKGNLFFFNKKASLSTHKGVVDKMFAVNIFIKI
jgi:hypothetical protein